MKSIVNKIALVFVFALALIGCKKEDELDHTKVTAVQSFYSPADNKYVQLLSSPSASLYFEWEQAKAEDGGLVMYEVAFDKVGGDFSNPIYKLSSDNNGVYNHATITHKVLNQIAAAAGIGSSETGKVIWTVISSKGINEMKSSEVRTLELTRLAGFADIPVDVYITGEGSEGGATLANALKFKSTASGEFEIYTKLTAGKTYNFVDRTSGTVRTFYTTGQSLKEGGNTTATKTAVYRIKLDFNTGAAIYTEVKKIELFFSPNNVFLFETPYVGAGVFKAVNQPITFKQESWGRDERYKFRMTVNDGTTDSYEWWGSKNSDNSRPTSASAASYWYLYPVSSDQWNYSFKFATEIDLSYSDVILYFTSDKAYTHEVIKKSAQ